jgi:hypothetical protein
MMAGGEELNQLSAELREGERVKPEEPVDQTNSYDS